MATVNTIHKNYSMLKKKSFNLKLRASIMSKMNSCGHMYGIKIQTVMFLTNLCGNEIFAMKGVIATVSSRIFAIFCTLCNRVFNSLYCKAEICLFSKSFRSDITSWLLWRKCISNRLRHFTKISQWMQELTSNIWKVVVVYAASWATFLAQARKIKKNLLRKIIS